jgi:hypothetical protein
MKFSTNNYTPSQEEPCNSTTKQSCASSPANKIQSNGLTKKTNSKSIQYPQLQEASMYTEDKFWINAILKAARGEFMNKFISYDGSYMYKRDAGIKERMPEDTRELCKMFIIFHKKYSGVQSTIDIERQKKLRKEMSQQEVNLTWDICNNEMKQSRLINYCYRMTSNTDDAIDMLSVVRAAQQLKLLTPSTVLMENNTITSISTVAYNKSTRKWYIL